MQKNRHCWVPSLLASLSSALEEFFSGYLNIIRQREKYRNTVNIVYAGGDDIFAVGRWDRIIDFAIEVRSEFKRLVGGRNDISISGGVAITGVKFPISKGAVLAAEAEQKAKDFKIDGKEKNALTLFGLPISFELEMLFVIEFKDHLIYWISGDFISRGLLMKLYQYYELYCSGKIDWQWQSAYSIARHEQSTKDPNKKEAYKR